MCFCPKFQGATLWQDCWQWPLSLPPAHGLWPYIQGLDPVRLCPLSSHQHWGNPEHFSATTHTLKADCDLESFAGSNQNIWHWLIWEALLSVNHILWALLQKPTVKDKCSETMRAAIARLLDKSELDWNINHEFLVCLWLHQYLWVKETSRPSDLELHTELQGTHHRMLSPRWALTSSKLCSSGFKENLPLIHLCFC